MIAGTIDAAAEAVSVGVLDPGDMMLMYGSTIFIILITEKRVRDRRLWYAPWLFPGQHASMSGLATSGTLTHWFREQLRARPDPATAVITLPPKPKRRRPVPRASSLSPISPASEPRSMTRMPRALFSGSTSPIRAAMSFVRFSRASPMARPYFRYLHRSRPRPEECLCRRRRYEEPCLVAGNVRYFRAKADRARQDHWRFLWRCFPRRAGDAGCQARRHRQWNPSRRNHARCRTSRLYNRQYCVFLDLYPRTRDLMHKLS